MVAPTPLPANRETPPYWLPARGSIYATAAVVKLQFINMNNSSDWFIQREVQKKTYGLPTETSYTFRQFLSRTLLTLFKYLATATSWMRRFSGLGESNRTEKPHRSSPEKVEFLEKYGNEYGFPEGPVSVDQLRSKEFARLEGKIYLDHAGATLYTETQLKATLADLSSNLYGNPHSQSESSTLSSDVIECARNQVLAMCKASPEEYTCVFTSGATGALKLVGETFPWSGNSHFMYTIENHNSVLGIREYALNQGAVVMPVCLDDNRLESSGGEDASKFQIRQCNAQRRDVTVAQDQVSSYEQGYNLFAFPLECNFSGAKVDLELIPFVQEAHHVKSKRGKWLVLLDAAKGCSTAPPNLSLFSADFVAISFYKIFGYPTGLGALLVRKDAAKLMKKAYFGGGTVAVAIADEDFVQRRPRVQQRLEDGTVSFLGIAALRHGFSVIDQLQMSAINRHAGSLASYTASKLNGLKHGNGTRVCVLYGNHEMPGRNNVKYWGSHCEQGPIVSFNLKRADSSWIGSHEVEKLAILSGIHLRAGCFCNPGACSKYLGLSKYEMKQNFEAGHVCWDDKDLINGCPTGAVRVSFGYMNTFEDCWAFLQFISKFFVELNPLATISHKEDNEARPFTRPPTNSMEIAITEESVGSLQSIVVYPIKSCGGFKSKAWPLGDCGLVYDREWLIMSFSGEVLTQKKCPMMCFVQTYVDLESGSLHVQAPNMKDELNIPLVEVAACNPSRDGCLGAELVGAKGSEAHASEWFTGALGIACKLVRKDPKTRVAGKSAGLEGTNVSGGEESNERSFANEGQLLLVSEDSVEDLKTRLPSLSGKTDARDQTSTSGQPRIQVDVDRFRPNLVVSGSVAYDEDNWQALLIGDQRFQVMGGCNRCKMINIDQLTGKCQESSEPLVTLASYRRVKGRIYFGILLEQDRGGAPMNLSSDHEQQRRPELDQSSPNECAGDFLRKRHSRVLEVGQKLVVARRAQSTVCGDLKEGRVCLWQTDSAPS